MFVQKQPIMVMPPAYLLEMRNWRWCKLTEVCLAAKMNAKIAGFRFDPTPEELVRRFADLVRLNRVPDHLKGKGNEPKPVKVFRYSVDGKGFWGTNVPMPDCRAPLNSKNFKLDIGTPYPKRLLVREDWARDTLDAIRQGIIEVVDYNIKKDDLCGFSAPGKYHRFIQRKVSEYR